MTERVCLYVYASAMTRAKSQIHGGWRVSSVQMTKHAPCELFNVSQFGVRAVEILLFFVRFWHENTAIFKKNEKK